MSQEDQYLNSGDSLEEANLDEAICRALKVETDPQRVTYLARYWTQQSRRQHVRRMIPLAAAAVLAFAICVIAWNRQRIAQPRLAVDDVGSVPATPDRLDTTSEGDPAGRPPSKRTGRLPTTYERFLFAARTRTQVPTIEPTLHTTIDAAIDKLTRDPDANVAHVFGASLHATGEAEELLLERLSESTGDTRAILRLLSACGTQRSLPAMLRLSQQASFRDDALATIERIAGVERLGEVAAATPHHDVRIAILHRLFVDESEPALREFLSLLRDKRTRHEALAVAEQSSHPPITSLVALLDDDEHGVRISAAILLGHMNGPAITKSLIGRVMQQPAESTEAWIALLACRGELAEEFFAYANERPKLLGHFNYARVRWAQMGQ